MLFSLMPKFWLVGLLSGALSIFPVLVRAASVDVQAPCSDNPTAGLKSCQEFLIDGTPASATVMDTDKGPLTVTVPKLPGVLEQLRQRVSEHIEGSAAKGLKGYYQQVDPPADLSKAGAYFGPTLCNLVPGPFNLQGPETSANRAGKSCGSPVNIEVTFDECVVLGCATCKNDPAMTIHKDYSPSTPDSSQGTLEDGYIRGALPQATTCFYQKIINDLKASKKITVADIGGQPSPCSTLGSHFSNLSGSLKANIDNLKSKLSAEDNISDAMNCRKTWDTSNAPGAPDKGPLRQSAQLLCAARSSIETMFVQLVSCEIFARSKLGYESLASSIQKQQELIQLLKGQISQPCADSCKTQLSPSICHVPSPTDVSSCANTCYQQKLPGAIKDFLIQHWPSDGSHCDLTMNLPGRPEDPATPHFLLIGMIGLLPRGRTRRKKSSASAKSAAVAGIWSVLLATTALVNNGCGASGTSTNDPGRSQGSPCVGIQTSPPGCCNPDGTVNSTLKGCSNISGGGGGAIASALHGAAQAGGSAQNALAGASSLLGPPGSANNTGGALAQGQAASSDLSGIPLAHPHGPIAAGGGGGTPAGGDPRANRKGGLGGGGGSGSASFGTTGLTTGVAGTLEQDPKDAAATTDSAGVYKSAAGAGNGAAEGAGFRSGFNSGDEAGGGSGNSETSFGAAQNADGATGKTAGTADPEDYFTRIGLEMNLFKIVEKRYREKSTHWASTSVETPASTSVKPLK